MTESSATEAPPGPTKAGLDIHEILKILPHRYPFLLIDRVIELVRKQRMTSIIDRPVAREMVRDSAWKTRV